MTRARSIPAAPAFVAALLLVFAALLRRLRVSGAVPPSEFEIAGPLYAAIVPLTVLGLALLAFVVWRWRGARAAAPLLAGSALLPALAAPGAAVLLVALAAALLVRPAAADEPALPRWRAREAPELFAALLVVGTGLAWAFARGEAALFTDRFFPRVFDAAAREEHREALPALALLLGGELALVFTVLLAGPWLLLRVLTRLPGAAPRAARLLAVVLGAALTVALLRLARGALADEIDQLGLGWESAAFCALLGGGWAGLAYDRWRASVSRDGPVDDLARWAALLPVWLLVPRRFAGHGRRPRLVATALGAGVVAATTAALYPEIEDFRMRLFGTLARIALYGAAWLLLALAGDALRRLPLRRVAAAVLALGLIALGVARFPATLRSDARQVAFEYSRFAALAAGSWLHRPFDPWVRLGDARPETARFPHPRAPGDARVVLPDRPPVFVVVWDAARPDHLSAYGYARDTTPNARRLAGRAVRFTQARSNATATTTAVRMLLSGTYTSRFMLSTEHPPFVLRELADAGYHRFVVTVTGNDHNGVSAESFRRGWDADRPGLEWIDLDYPNVTDAVPDAAKTRDVVARLEAIHDAQGAAGLRGTFVYLHLTGTHTPWRDPEPGFDLGPRPVDRYDAEIARADALLGELLGGLERLGIADESVLVLCADHGTGLREHGKIAGFLPYEEQVRIPLLIAAPGLAPRVVDDPVAAIDLAPTLAHLLAGRVPDRFHGRSLVALLSGEAAALPPRPVVCLDAFDDSYAILDGEARWKLHHHRGKRYVALYDLAADPGETRSRARTPPGSAALSDLLADWLWQGRGTWANPRHYRGPDPADAAEKPR